MMGLIYGFLLVYLCVVLVVGGYQLGRVARCERCFPKTEERQQHG